MVAGSTPAPRTQAEEQDMSQKTYFVVCDQECPGIECDSWEEAREVLLGVRNEFPEAIILLPNDSGNHWEFSDYMDCEPLK